MLAESTLLLLLLASFPLVSPLHPLAFAASLCLCYLAFSGVYAVHPAACARIFGARDVAAAVGLVGSSGEGFRSHEGANIG